MNQHADITKIIRQQGKFFMMRVQDMIKVSKLPVPPARSVTHTLIYLTDGVASMKIGSEKVKIRKNECMVVAAGKIFSYEKYEVNKGYIFNFDNAFLSSLISHKHILHEFEFLQVWGKAVIKPGTERGRYLTQLFERILSAFESDGISQDNIIPSYLLAALFELNASYQRVKETKPKASSDISNRFIELLYQNIKSKHLVSEYAALLHVTPNHLNKILKETTGRSPSKWIDETLVLEAKVLLFQTSFSIGEIASDLGIEDASYFSRLFKRYEGVTPWAFRQMIEKS
jgi:AraC-like DNA-binding protein/ribosomal protein L21